MKGWTRINSYSRLYNAELHKDILENNNVNAIILKKRDSAFLIGTIDLYVKNESAEKARALIDEFRGWTKVNSFIKYEQVEQAQIILQNNNINSLLMKKEDSDFLTDNFELFVKNEQAEEARKALHDIENWTKIAVFDKQRQALIRVELLEEQDVVPIIIKQRDSDYHLEEVGVLVRNEDVEKAKKIIDEFAGWETIKTYDDIVRAELREDMLFQYGIKAAIVVKERDSDDEPVKLDLCVERENTDIAKAALEEHTDWRKVSSFNRLHQALYRKEILQQTGIEAIIVQKRDSAFLLGDIQLYVDCDNLEKAIKILEEYENAINSQTPEETEEENEENDKE